jgi:arylsulfatase A
VKARESVAHAARLEAETAKKGGKAMKRFPIVLLAACWGLVSWAGAAPGPNFVVINIDDLGYADTGPFGSTLNRTPNLDRMAKEGMRLTSFYAAPVCSPSRAALMTGCYPKRVLPTPHVLFPASAIALNPDSPTVAELLKREGYATACIGKWHLGDQPPFLPRKRGFDTYFGLPYSNDMGPAADGSKSSLGDPLPQPKPGKAGGPPSDEAGLRGAAQPPLPLVENETVVRRVGPADQQELVAAYTARAVEFIRAQKDRSFFLYLPHSAVHFPIYPGKAFVGKSGNGIYGDWVEEVDWSVGRILDTLRELKLDGKTLVLFTSDNGGTARAVNTPLRGNKGSTLEGGIRVPLIAWWPGRIPAGASSDAIASMMDVLPTLVGLAGGRVPPGRIDGVDQWPVLSGKPGAKPPRDSFLYFRGLKLEAVRSGPWKLHLAKGELHNLDADIGEATNAAAANPDVVARLRALAEATKDDLGLDGVGPGCRPAGRVERPVPLIPADGR